MFELWVPITIAAVIFQTVRTGLQKHLKAELTTSAVTYVRFLFGMPLAALYLASLVWTTDAPVPAISRRERTFSTQSARSCGGAASISAQSPKSSA